MSRRALQVVLAALSLVPLLVAVSTVVGGTGRFADPQSVPPGLDQQLRYLAGYYVSLALLAWYVIPRVEQRRAVLAIGVGAVFTGGVGRTLSIVAVGAAGPEQYVLAAFELLLPLLLLWQRSLPTSPTSPTSPGATRETPETRETGAAAGEP